ncbi:MAG: hypothetical protein A2269_05905 [Lentisphaerae bacterium RIFOXYA12_FULL_60_10]|nr:MAG: hypothetical protein A2269_05905 [Lentisphaerae bacterium RIFOXYA12_FULL_60_10]
MTMMRKAGICRGCVVLAVWVLMSGIAGHAEPAPARMVSPSFAYLQTVLEACDRALTNLPAFTATAERMAVRHLKGGVIGTYWGNQSLGPELYGRSGNFVHIGHERPWKKDRTDAERAEDMTILGFDRALDAEDRGFLERDKKRGFLMIGLGPRDHPDIAPVVPEFEVFFDTGTGADDRQVLLSDGTRVGHLNHVINALHGWVLMAETVGALTRHGKMPTMWKSYGWPDGKDWGNRYLGKQQFHDDIQVPPCPAGELGRRYIEAIRSLVIQFRDRELDSVRQAGVRMGDEIKAGRKIQVAWEGHMPEGYVALRDDAAWCVSVQLHLFLESQREGFRKGVPDGALVLRLGTYGLDPLGPPLFKEKNQPWILVAGDHNQPDWLGEKAGAPLYVPLRFPFGDACVNLEGYPIPLFAPSGIMQAVAYEAILVEAIAHRDQSGMVEPQSGKPRVPIAPPPPPQDAP